MQFILDYGSVIIAAIALITVMATSVITFFELPRKKQVLAVKEWLLFAVTKAEKELGSGTGQLKLRYVYDLFVSKFKFASFVSFDLFSEWVDEALEKMRHMLSTNSNAAAYVDNEQEKVQA